MAERGSFSQAALDLHFTQSAVSQQVATLERDLGVRLVERGPVALTEAGAALCRRYESAVAELAAAQSELEYYREGGRGRLRVAAPAGVMARLVPSAAAAMAAAHPDVRMSLHPLGPSESLAALQRGEADIAIGWDYDAVARPRPTVWRVPLVRDNLTVAVPDGHRLARRGRVYLSELAAERWVHAADEEIPRDFLERAFSGAALEPNLVVEGHGFDVCQALVAAGAGVALIPELDRRPDLALTHLAIGGEGFGRSLYAAALEPHPSNGLVASMLEAFALAGRRLGAALARSRRPVDVRFPAGVGC